MREFSFLKDKDGKIIYFADGMPIPYDLFDNDPFDADDKREMLEYCLKTGVAVSGAVLRKNGFKKADGEWRYDRGNT